MSIFTQHQWRRYGESEWMLLKLWIQRTYLTWEDSMVWVFLKLWIQRTYVGQFLMLRARWDYIVINYECKYDQQRDLAQLITRSNSSARYKVLSYSTSRKIGHSHVCTNYAIGGQCVVTSSSETLTGLHHLKHYLHRTTGKEYNRFWSPWILRSTYFSQLSKHSSTKYIMDC